MSIRIDRSVGQIVGAPDSIAVQVQDASDPDAAAGALAFAAGDICAVVHPECDDAGEDMLDFTGFPAPTGSCG